MGLLVVQAVAHAAQAQADRDLDALHTGLVTLSALMTEIARAPTSAQRARLRAEGDSVLRTDLALLAAIDARCVGGAPPSSSVAPGGAPTPRGTPLPPAVGTPFPFSGGTAPMP